MIHKPGNPHGVLREKDLEKITFKVDPRTKQRLLELEEDFGPKVRGRTSIVIRRAIDEMWERRNK
jgi:hypothetical protein